MDCSDAVKKLSARRPELEQLGIRQLSVFGSTARDEAGGASDVDVAVVFDPARIPHGLAYVGHLDEVERRISDILGTRVDVVPEPARKKGLQDIIERERRRVF